MLSGAYRTDGHAHQLDAELAEAKSGRIVWTERLDDQVAGIAERRARADRSPDRGVGSAMMSRELQRARSQPLPTLKTYTLLMGAIA